MKVWELTRMLTPETVCKIVDADSGEDMRTSTAGAITAERVEDRIRDWDFSESHIIYI